MWSIVYRALTALPSFSVLAALAAAAAFPKFRDWLQDAVVSAVGAMESPVVVGLLLVAIALYVIAIFTAGHFDKVSQKPRPDLRAKIKNIAFGGQFEEVIQRGFRDGSPRKLFLANIEIRNCGNMRSAISAHSWRAELRTRKTRSPLEILRLHGPLTVLDDNGQGVRLNPEDNMLHIGATPIDEGALCDGYIMAAAKDEQIAAFRDGAELTFSFEDITGKRSEVTRVTDRGLTRPYFNIGKPVE